MLLRLVFCGVFSAWNCVTDWRSYQIRNRVVVPFFFLGLGINFLQSGLPGLWSALAGAALMLLLFPLFALRALGAGDVKALMSIGAMVGYPAAGEALVCSLLGGGIAALWVVLARRNLTARLRQFLSYCKRCVLTQRLEEYDRDACSGGGFRFSFGIALGVLLMLIRRLL